MELPQSAAVPIVFLDRHGMVERLAQDVASLFELGTPDLGQPFEAVLERAGRLEPPGAVTQALTSGTATLATLHQADGSRRWRLLVLPQAAGHGATIAVIGPLPATAGASAPTPRQQAAIMDALPMPAALLDSGGKLLMANAAWMRLAQPFPFAGAAVCPGDDYPAACATSAGLEPGQGDAIAEGLRGLLAGQAAAFQHKYAYTHDAQIRWFSLRAFMYSGDDSGGCLILQEDATAVRQARLSSEEREAYLKAILDTVPDAMIVIDGDGIIQSFSATAERMFGYAAREICGSNISLLMPSPYREAHDGYLERYRRSRERHIIGIGRLVTGQRRDGNTFPMELTVGEVSGGSKTLFTGFVRDVTARQETEAQLQELQSELLHVSRLSAMGQMAATLAHELNQPLAAVANYLRACQRLIDAPASTTPDFARIREAVGLAAEQALRSGQIIRRLRDFVEHGETERRTEDAAQLTEEAGTLALVGIRQRNIRVHLALDRGLPKVIVDRVQVQQVLLNLIRNAIEAVEGAVRREITISVVAAGAERGMVEFRVADTGCGLPADVIARLFQPFVTTKREGLGVGLSVCRTIVESHGGRIWAEPVALGGTVFRFTIPAITEADGA